MSKMACFADDAPLARLAAKSAKESQKEHAVTCDEGRSEPI